MQGKGLSTVCVEISLDGGNNSKPCFQQFLTFFFLKSLDQPFRDQNLCVCEGAECGHVFLVYYSLGALILAERVSFHQILFELYSSFFFFFPLRELATCNDFLIGLAPILPSHQIKKERSMCLH